MAHIRVLVVDDDLDARSMCAVWLRLERFDVQTAGDGIAALRLLETYRPNVVVLDLRMPFADGFEVLRELRASPDTRRTPVIVISGDSRGLKLARDNPEVFAALLKPFSPADLVAAIFRAALLWPDDPEPSA